VCKHSLLSLPHSSFLSNLGLLHILISRNISGRFNFVFFSVIACPQVSIPLLSVDSQFSPLIAFTLARYGTPQQSAYLQSEVGPQTPSTPLSQQRFSGSIPSGQVPNGGHQQLTPSNSSTNMRSPPLVSPAQAQIPPHQMRAIPPTMQPILHPQLQQQHSSNLGLF
jgi:hypothetical protein